MRVALLVVLGWLVTGVAFILPMADTWTRLIAALTTLAAVGLAINFRQRQTLLSIDARQALLGAAAGVAMYLAAWLLSGAAPIAAQARLVYLWRSGHAPLQLGLTLVLAVLGEEIFWRATVLRLLLARHPPLCALTLATLAYALPHAASGTWLLPLAACGAGSVWAALFVWTGNLTAATSSHLVFDLLVLLIAPLA